MIFSLARYLHIFCALTILVIVFLGGLIGGGLSENSLYFFFTLFILFSCAGWIAGNFSRSQHKNLFFVIYTLIIMLIIFILLIAVSPYSLINSLITNSVLNTEETIIIYFIILPAQFLIWLVLYFTSFVSNKQQYPSPFISMPRIIFGFVLLVFIIFSGALIATFIYGKNKALNRALQVEQETQDNVTQFNIQYKPLSSDLPIHKIYAEFGVLKVTYKCPTSQNSDAWLIVSQIPITARPLENYYLGDGYDGLNPSKENVDINGNSGKIWSLNNRSQIAFRTPTVVVEIKGNDWCYLNKETILQFARSMK